MWFQVRPVDLSFTKSSPFQFHNEAVIRAAPERVFEIMALGEEQRVWFKDFVEVRWTSAPPHGVGSMREVELKTLTVKERVLAWDPGKRLSFCIYAITVPLVSAMVEDLELIAEDGGTRVRWIVHYEPSLVMRALHGPVRSKFGEMFRQTLEGLTRYAESKAR